MSQKIKILFLVIIILSLSMMIAALLIIKNGFVNQGQIETEVRSEEKISLSSLEYEEILISLEPRATESMMSRPEEYAKIMTTLEPVSATTYLPAELFSKINAEK